MLSVCTSHQSLDVDNRVTDAPAMVPKDFATPKFSWALAAGSVAKASKKL